jgi:hypothetical protein
MVVMLEHSLWLEKSGALAGSGLVIRLPDGLRCCVPQPGCAWPNESRHAKLYTHKYRSGNPQLQKG